MDVIRPHVRGKQAPSAFCTPFNDCGEDRFASTLIHLVFGLRHRVAGQRSAGMVRFEHSTAGQVVIAVDRSGFIAVQVRAVAGEGDQVSHMRNFKPLNHMRNLKPLPLVTARVAARILPF